MGSMKKRLGITVLAGSFLVFASMFIQVSPATGSTSGEADNVYKAKCAMCHGADLSGNTAMGKKLSVRDLRSAPVQAQSDAQLHNIIAKGKGKMPGYGKSLNQQQINQLVAFIRERAQKR